VTHHLNPNKFVRPSGEPVNTSLSLKEFAKLAEAHGGIFVLDGTDYDHILYCGSDNLYFSYRFNSNSGKAVNETLLIVDTITEINSQYVIVDAHGKGYSVFFKE